MLSTLLGNDSVASVDPANMMYHINKTDISLTNPSVLFWAVCMPEICAEIGMADLVLKATVHQ